jgi:hypothetical protein
MTGIIVYVSTVYVRKMNQVLKVLQQIEARHRAALGAATLQRVTPQQWPSVSVVCQGLAPESSVRVWECSSEFNVTRQFVPANRHVQGQTCQTSDSGSVV